MKKTIFNFETRTEETIDIYDVAHCDRKSFYGKAKIIETSTAYYLLSYSTIVCKVDKDTHEFSRFWSGESATTTRHINGFLDDMNINGGGVAWWRKQPVIGEDTFASNFQYSRRYA